MLLTMCVSVRFSSRRRKKKQFVCTHKLNTRKKQSTELTEKMLSGIFRHGPHQ